MKKEYKSPILSVEELIKEDVLLVSNNDNGTMTFSDMFGGDNGQYVWNGFDGK